MVIAYGSEHIVVYHKKITEIYSKLLLLYYRIENIFLRHWCMYMIYDISVGCDLYWFF